MKGRRKTEGKEGSRRNPKEKEEKKGQEDDKQA